VSIYRLCVAAACLGATVQARSADRLTLNTLVAEALDRNPEIRAAQKRYEGLRQRTRVEGALPDPMIGIGWNSSGNPVPFQGVGREPVANVGLMVTQQLPYPGKRGLRQKIAGTEAEAEWQRYLEAQLSVMARVKQAYFRLQHTWEMEEVLGRSREWLRKLLEIAQIRYSVGKAMQADVLRLQTQLSLLETRSIQYEREKRAREAELNALLNQPVDRPLAEPLDPHAEPLLVPLEELYASAADTSPLLRREEKMIQRGEAAVSMARREFWPDFAITGGYYYMGVMPAMYMFRLDMNIPVWWNRKQRPAVTAEVQSLNQSRHNYEAASRGLQARIRDDYLMATTSLKLLGLYRDTVIPQATLTFESSMSSYETGSGTFSDVLMNAMTAVEYEMNYHEEMLNYHVALARLEEITGRELLHPAGGRP
jgi:outer membrane protein, heavy metal efflux system